MASVHPRVGVAAIILNPKDQILLGRRKGSHGAGTWQLPGGHLEFGEDPKTCAVRETLEETGLEVAASQIVAVTNDVFAAENKHYITLFVLCEMKDSSVEPQLLEPEKCDGWFWRSWDELKQLHADADADAKNQLFLPLGSLVKSITSLEDLRRRSLE